MIIPVQDLTDPALSIFHTLNEAQLRHYFEPHGGLFIAEMASRQTVADALGWDLCRDREYGKTRLLIWKRH